MQNLDHGKILLGCLLNLNGASFSFDSDLYNFCTIKNFSLCYVELVILIEYTESTKSIKCTNADEFIYLLKKMEAAYSVFVFEQENLCH